MAFFDQKFIKTFCSRYGNVYTCRLQALRY